MWFDRDLIPTAHIMLLVMLIFTLYVLAHKPGRKIHKTIIPNLWTTIQNQQESTIRETICTTIY